MKKPIEIARKLSERYGLDRSATLDIAAALRTYGDARAEEMRERCAKIADELHLRSCEDMKRADSDEFDEAGGRSYAAYVIAKEIRELSLDKQA